MNLFGVFRVSYNILDIGFFGPGIDLCRLVTGILDVHEGRVGLDDSVLDLSDGCVEEREQQNCKPKETINRRI